MIKNIVIILLLCMLVYSNYDKIRKYLCYRKYIPKQYKIPVKMVLVEKQRKIVDSFIRRDIKTIADQKLHDILLYSLEDGKRIRPIILLSIYKKLNRTNNIPMYVWNSALSVEYVHSSSLVADDIMDDDTERRGIPCVHIKYGNTLAQLSSIILCSRALQNIFKCFDLLHQEKQNTNSKILLIAGELISNLISDLSMGQYLDVTMPSTYSELADTLKNSIKINKLKTSVNELIHKKTSSLFEFCFIMPWILSNSEKTDTEIKQKIVVLQNIARLFGLIFQIADDFEDVERDVHRDGKNSVMNYVINRGYDKAYIDYFSIVEQFRRGCNDENIWTDEIEEIIVYLNKKVEVYNNHRYYND